MSCFQLKIFVRSVSVGSQGWISVFLEESKGLIREAFRRGGAARVQAERRMRGRVVRRSILGILGFLVGEVDVRRWKRKSMEEEKGRRRES
jgi:hypothetical protein